MSDVWIMGELLVEIMRPRPGMELHETGPFLGPFPSGAPGIFIDTVARLGHSASIVSGVGDDDFGRCVTGRLAADGVRTDLVQVFPGASTGTAFVTYFRDGSRKFLFHWGGTAAVMAKAPDPASIGSPKYLHVMGCSLMANDGFRRRVLETVELFVAAGARITFDPNIRTELMRGRSVEEIAGPALLRSSIIFPGEKELALLGDSEDLEKAARALFERPSLELVVLKRGRRGCTVISRTHAIDVPAFRVREVDPTGAGDSFDAGFICAQLEGKDFRESALMASAAGALTAEAFGPMEGRIDARTVAAMVRKRSGGR